MFTTKCTPSSSLITIVIQKNLAGICNSSDMWHDVPYFFFHESHYFTRGCDNYYNMPYVFSKVNLFGIVNTKSHCTSCSRNVL